MSLRTFAAKLLGLPVTAPPAPRPTEPANLSASLTAARLQSAIRSAETGDTSTLFTLYRDAMFDNHVQAELQKRKLAIVNQPWSLVPDDADEPDDVAAAEAVDEMISHCANWSDGLGHLLDATIWPVAVVEKIYRAGSEGLRYELDQLAPVNPALLCFRQAANPSSALDLAPKAEGWEPDIRLYAVDPQTRTVSRDLTRAKPLDPMRHLVHRGHLMTGQRDYFGGPIRGVMSWWLLRGLSREWFAQAMERYGSPFILGKVDATNTQAVAFLQEQFAAATRIRGLVVDESAQIELKEIALAGLADAHERFANFCDRQISLLIVGQTLSSQAQPTGLGSGTANLQSEVRADLRAWDCLRLGETLREQLFRPFLEINGLAGDPPRILWGGDDPAERLGLADLLVKLNQASLEPADESIPVLSEKIGFAIQRKAAPVMPGFAGGETTNGRNAEPAPNAERALPLPAGEGRGEGERSDDTEAEPIALSARLAPAVRLPGVDTAALTSAYRGAMAPFRAALLESTSRDDALRRLRLLYADWPAERLAAELDRALQLAAAAGAASAVQPVRP